MSFSEQIINNNFILAIPTICIVSENKPSEGSVVKARKYKCSNELTARKVGGYTGKYKF